MFGFRRQTRTAPPPPAAAPEPVPAPARPVAPVRNPDDVFHEMVLNFQFGNSLAAERAAESLHGWLLHGGYPPTSYTRDSVLEMVAVVRGEAARQRGLRDARPDILAALCEQVRQLRDEARQERELDMVLVLDALAEATVHGKLREFAVAVDRLKAEIGIS